jgi:hypothetical protein
MSSRIELMSRNGKNQLLVALLAFYAAMILAASLFLAAVEQFALKTHVHLRYPNGLTFFFRHDHVAHAKWSCKDVNNPEPCPFSIQLPGGNLNPDHLASQNRLLAEGWQQKTHGDEIEMCGMNEMLCCRFREMKLVGVEMYGNPRFPSSMSIDLNGKIIPLSASKASIIETLGPPSD